MAKNIPELTVTAPSLFEGKQLLEDVEKTLKEIEEKRRELHEQKEALKGKTEEPSRLKDLSMLSKAAEKFISTTRGKKSIESIDAQLVLLDVYQSEQTGEKLLAAAKCYRKGISEFKYLADEEKENLCLRNVREFDAKVIGFNSDIQEYIYIYNSLLSLAGFYDRNKATQKTYNGEEIPLLSLRNGDLISLLEKNLRGALYAK